MKFRKKPIEIEAVQYQGDNYIEIRNFTNGEARTNTCCDFLTIPTLEGDMRANIGDWIIKGIQGECYPCKPDIFDATYEKVEWRP